jgi:hypothetical protein
MGTKCCKCDACGTLIHGGCFSSCTCLNVEMPGTAYLPCPGGRSATARRLPAWRTRAWLGRGKLSTHEPGLPNLVDLRAIIPLQSLPTGPALLAAKLPYRQRMGRPSTQKRRADPNAATLANPGSGNARSRTSHAGARCPLPVLPQEPQTPYRPANRTISLPDETEPSP